MTTPGGVPNLPQGALTLSNLASDLQDMSGTAMRSRAVQRFPNIFNNSTGLNPAVDLTPFGILTAIWAQVNSLIANADPADVQGPQDIPALVLQFIEGLPVVGQFFGLLAAILGTYTGTDSQLLQVQAIFAPIRLLTQLVSGTSTGFPTTGQITSGWANIPLIGPLLAAITGSSTTGGGGLSGLTTFFTDFRGIFGNPTGLGTGSPTIPGLSSIPILGPVLGLFGGATNATQATNFFTNLLAMFGNPSGLLGGAGAFNPAGVIPFGNVAGIQGIIDVGATAQNTWNSLATAFGGTLAAHNEAQQITVGDTGGGTVTSGTTLLDFQGQTTSPVAYNATAATVQTALTALSTIGSGNLVASGGPLNTAPVTVTFQGTLANTALPLIGHTDSLVGGTGPRATVSETVRGGNSVTLSDMTLLAQQQTANASGAINLSGGLSNILNIRDNKPGYAGLQRTVESTFNHVQLQGASPPSTIGVTSTVAPMGLLRTQGADSKGIVEWLGNGNTNITTFKVNVYKMDQTTGDLTLMHTSPDLHTDLSAAGTWTWSRYTFSGPNQTPVNAGDVLAAEFIVTGTGTHTIAAIPMTWVPTHPTAQLKSLSASRNPATLGASPTSIPAANIGWAGITAVPYVGFGITNFPANYQPPVTTQYSTAGSYTYTIPSWAKVVGAKLNIVVLGSGGGGQANYGTLTWWTGGNAGTWATQTLVCGTDYPTSATSLAVVVGAKGLGAGGYWTNGHPGNISTITWTDPSSVVHTITGNGGAGGGNAGTSATSGKSPGNTTLDGTTYYGGTAVGGNATGSPPGGGGGGAGPYQTGGDGADGSAWIEAKQP